jgi:large subunit ribosomal protein L10
MPKELKRLMADELRHDLEGSPNLLVIGLLPMDAAGTAELRNRLRERGARLRVIQNRTSRYALDDARKRIGEYFEGPTGLTLVPGEEPDMGGIAKTLVEIARKKTIEIRGGFVEGTVLDKGGVELLASMPDKKTLRAMMCGALLGPARGIAASMNAVLAGLARCLKERTEKMPAEAPAEAAAKPAETETKPAEPGAGTETNPT